MKYKNIKIGKFIERPNRFIAKVDIDGVIETVHVKNTGRCRVLLINGRKAVLATSENTKRKTKYDLIAVDKNGVLVNIDSQAPNAAAFEWIKSGGIFSKNAFVRREVAFGNSRFDLYVEDGDKKAFIEVKGVTLEDNGIAMFPDAPTERGAKHLKELIESKNKGYEAYILFVIQMKGISKFFPNDKTDPNFSAALREAEKQGVNILVYDCEVGFDHMKIDKPVAFETERKI